MRHIRLGASIAIGAAAAVIGMGVVVEATAQDATTHIGVLTCTTAQNTPSRMTCGFKPTKGSAVERYVGTLPNGDVWSDKRVLVWAVIAPATTKIARGALSQRYRISTAGPVLIGETLAIALQSEASDGSSGVTQLELTLATTLGS